MEELEKNLIITFSIIGICLLFLSISVSLIETKTNYLYYLNTRTYIQDMRFPASDFSLGGLNDPTLSTYKGFHVWEFSSTKYNELETVFQYPYIEDGTITYTIRPHFHWTMTQNITGTQCITWGGEYSCANIDSYFNLTNKIVKTTTCYTGNTANKHIMTYLDNITLPFYSNSRQCLLKIFRDGANASDNFTQSAILLEFDIHYHYKKYGEQID